MIRNPNEALSRYFGYDKFRSLQEEIIRDVLSGNDVLVLMPTGGGKSLCYQIPALCSDGLTLVISPLISLMKDQVDALKVNGIHAEYMNSSLSVKDQDAILHRALAGELDLLYLSPEKVLSQEVFSLLPDLNIRILAVDEAHCISQWGHDFRPEYTSLFRVRAQLGENASVIALTATADKVTRRDILNGLSIPNENVYLASFNRPNLSLKVMPGTDRKNRLLQIIHQFEYESGIVYCLSRKGTEKLADFLVEKGFNAAAYHAGMSSSKRDAVQSAFISDEVKIVCATIAFGMGIDKPNLRFVVHYNLPQSMEHFYQEIGRAGRDGLPSETVLMFSFGDVSTYHRFFEESENCEIRKEKLQRIIQYAQSPVCRRRIVLNYFGEELNEDCGNCDVCHNPPETIDGTITAQKVLSAIVRTRQSEPMNTIIDVLRGSLKSEIRNKNYHTLPTHGVGKDLSFFDWQYAIQQLVDMGFIEVEIDNGSKLLVTDKGREVLRGETKVLLVERVEEEKPIRKTKFRKRTKEQVFQEHLEDEIRKFRRDLAAKNELAPYHVFGDKELGLLMDHLPGNIDQLKALSGFGEARVARFGEEICHFINERVVRAEEEKMYKVKGVTYRKTWLLLKSGQGVEEIAKNRKLSITTIYTHLAYLYENGFSIDLANYMEDRTRKEIIQTWKDLGEPDELSQVRDQLSSVNFGMIKLAIAAAL